MILLIGFVVFVLSYLILVTSPLFDSNILLNSIRSAVLALFSMLLYKITRHI
jgi:hypothetical protein